MSTAPAHRPFVIVGAGGHGREILDLVESVGRRSEFVGFVDDGEPPPIALDRLARRGASIVGDVAWLAGRGHDFVIGIGTSAVRRRVDEALAGGAGLAVTLQHATASVGSAVDLAPGVVIGARSTVTTNVAIGRHTHVNVGCAIQHDSTLDEFVTVSPGVLINGDVHVGADVFIGSGAVITRGCTVGARATIGAGAVVLTDVAPDETVFGIPARPHARRV